MFLGLDFASFSHCESVKPTVSLVLYWKLYVYWTVLKSRNKTKLHLQNGSDKLRCHLSVLYQIVFCCDIVLDSFCVGLISLILKKGKDLSECSSYWPITVSSVFAKVFELLIINNLCSLCYMPPHQFGFQPKLGCFHALNFCAMCWSMQINLVVL